MGKWSESSGLAETQGMMSSKQCRVDYEELIKTYTERKEAALNLKEALERFILSGSSIDRTSAYELYGFLHFTAVHAHTQVESYIKEYEASK